MKKRLIRLGVMAVIGGALGAGLGYIKAHKEVASVQNRGSTDSAEGSMAGVKIGGPFSLTNQDGETVTQDDFTGQYKLIYFGFTYCPAICPTELQKISKVMDNLGNDGKNIQPIFISVDPGRDTPEVLREYVTLFHPRLIGLTGTESQIEDVKKSYRIYASKVESEETQDYTVDHSSFIYLMSPDNALISMYRIQDDADMITKDIRQKTGSDG